ncbi:ABC transporter permease [Aquabacter cavernae]|uniref:ABC transporter permease n=1 Tax=Aquabacter cavernae TaxID=2496029 RepID=UPI000F8F110F|nr:ABC transporter permease [Aquabacter cavernae]
MTLIERFASVLVWTLAAFTVVFLLTPLAVTVAVSFGSSAVFTLPAPSFSLRWYEAMGRSRDLWPAVATSLQLAVVSTLIALVLGTLAAIGLLRGRFPGRGAAVTFLVSPLMLPGLVLGIAMLEAFRGAGLRSVWASLILAHVVITLPYVVRTVYASLSLFDFTLIDAARILGLSYPKAVVKVMVPSLAPAFVTSGMFAFLASMDNYPISIFFTNAWTKTLPIQMLQYVEESPDPMIAAVSSLLILLAMLVLLVGDRLVGLRRMADL